MRFFNYNLNTDIEGIDFVRPAQKPLVVNCLNPHSFVTALGDPSFRSALEESSILLPDGVGVCMALKRYKDEEIHKIAGDDLHHQMLSQAEAIGGKVFYMGSTPEVLRLIEEHLHRDFPNIQVKTHSPSYCAEMSEEENSEVVEMINAFEPDILFVGLGAPKQEKWVHRNSSRLNAKSIANIGGAFEFYAGTIKRAPQWAISLRLEWLVRFLHEPKRMWERNMVSSPRFLRYTRQHCAEM